MIVDAGNFNEGIGRYKRLQSKYILKGMTLLKYDVINLGEKDLLLGKKYLSMIKNEFNVPFISANIYDSKSHKLFVSPFIIKRFGSKKTFGIEHGGFKVGVFGITTTNLPKISVQGNEQDFYVKDPVETAKQMVIKLQKVCDIIVVLSSLGAEKSKELAQKIAGIDVIVNSRYSEVQHEPLVVENTLIIQPGLLGKYIGDLKLNLDNKYNISDYNGSLTPLTAEFSDDSLMVEVLKQYKNELTGEIAKKTKPKIIHATLAMYVGAEICIDCHDSQYSHWKYTRHADAFGTLKDKKNEQNPNCQKCHTTGFKEFNGFDDLSSTPGMTNVQCESCHGYMFKHLHNIKNNKPIEDSLNQAIGTRDNFRKIKSIYMSACVKCHDNEHSPDFNFDEYIKKIIH